MPEQTYKYTDEQIVTMEGVEHIRRRPGMYIGRLGDGRNPGDGIYVLLNGQNSPGGGFSGGAVLGAGMIIFASAFGQDGRRRRLYSGRDRKRGCIAG